MQAARCRCIAGHVELPDAAGEAFNSVMFHPFRLALSTHIVARMTASLSRPSPGTISPQNLAYLDEHLQRYISSGRLTGTLTVIYHKDQIAHWSAQGLRDRERNKPITDDTIFRIYSMTKPIASVALMQLYERGLFQLDDPVHRVHPVLGEPAGLPVRAAIPTSRRRRASAR